MGRTFLGPMTSVMPERKSIYDGEAKRVGRRYEDLSANFLCTSFDMTVIGSTTYITQCKKRCIKKGDDAQDEEQ